MHTCTHARTGVVEFPDGLQVHEGAEDAFHITEGDAYSAYTTCKRAMAYRRGDWKVRIEAEASMRANRDSFVVESVLTCWEGDAAEEAESARLSTEAAAAVMRWQCEVPRDHQ